ncbi:hypothetical protein BC828DRAFT_402294 [Blastocladiella britannica]|nr:hypothetical protein BC828DRAFT_402294 [Blastocladiella britannica]
MSKYTALGAAGSDDDEEENGPSFAPTAKPPASGTAATGLTLDDHADRLQFQQFTAPASAAPPAYAPAPTVSPVQSLPSPPPPQQPQQQHQQQQEQQHLRQPLPPPADAKLWQIEYYARWFDVDTGDVVHRMRLALYPNTMFLNALLIKQDLWGPFWIPTSLVFMLFVTSSIAHSIAAYSAGKEYIYDFTRLSAAVTTIYTYCFGPPALLYGIARYYGRNTSLIDLWGIYGYGVTMWLPTALLCIIPLDLMRWIIVILTTALTGMFLGRNIHLQLCELTPANPTALPASAVKLTLLGSAIAHGVFGLLLKLLFFSYSFTA